MCFILSYKVDNISIYHCLYIKATRVTIICKIILRLSTQCAWNSRKTGSNDQITWELNTKFVSNIFFLIVDVLKDAFTKISNYWVNDGTLSSLSIADEIILGIMKGDWAAAWALYVEDNDELPINSKHHVENIWWLMN